MIIVISSKYLHVILLPFHVILEKRVLGAVDCMNGIFLES